jgi:hypothetical protein
MIADSNDISFMVALQANNELVIKRKEILVKLKNI